MQSLVFELRPPNKECCSIDSFFVFQSDSLPEHLQPVRYVKAHIPQTRGTKVTVKLSILLL